MEIKSCLVVLLLFCKHSSQSVLYVCFVFNRITGATPIRTWAMILTGRWRTSRPRPALPVRALQLEGATTCSSKRPTRATSGTRQREYPSVSWRSSVCRVWNFSKRQKCEVDMKWAQILSRNYTNTLFCTEWCWRLNLGHSFTIDLCIDTLPAPG